MPYYALDEDGKFEGYWIPRVITLYCDGEDCKPEERECGGCILGWRAAKTGAKERFIRYGNLTKIDTPFGLLPENIRTALREAASKGAQIQDARFGYEEGWSDCRPYWVDNCIFRVSPDWKPKKKSEEKKAPVAFTENQLDIIREIKELTEEILGRKK